MYNCIVKSINSSIDNIWFDDLSTKVSTYIDQSEVAFIYEQKRILLKCEKCQHLTTFADFLDLNVVNQNPVITIYKIVKRYGPKVEHYIHPNINEINLIQTSKVCTKCQSLDSINMAKIDPSNFLAIKFPDLFFTDNDFGIEHTTFFNAVSLDNDNSKFLIKQDDNNTIVRFGVKNKKMYDIVTLRIDTANIMLYSRGQPYTNTIKPDESFSKVFEYTIKLVPHYWMPQNGHLFEDDKRIRKELLALRSAVQLPKDVILYIGRFL